MHSHRTGAESPGDSKGKKAGGLVTTGKKPLEVLWVSRGDDAD